MSHKALVREEFLHPLCINSLLATLSEHCFAISINTLFTWSFPSFLKTLTNICFQYSVSWRYDFNHTKSGVVTFGELKPSHSRSMTQREWILENDVLDELNEYKNLGVVKNDVCSFSSNVDEYFK